MIKIATTNGYDNNTIVYKELTGSSGIYINEDITSVRIAVTDIPCPPSMKLSCGPENSILMTKNGIVNWVSLEEALDTLLDNEAVCSCIEKIISAKKQLAMTIKLYKE